MPTPECTTRLVYRIVCFPTAKTYIGQTNNAKTRRARHFRDLRRGMHTNSHLQRAYDKYGAGSFYFEVLEKNISIGDIDERERYWIDHFDSCQNGYNQQPGGQNGGRLERPFEWNGILYPSVSEASLANNISTTALYARRSRGITSDAEMVGSRGNSPKRSCVWDGVIYPTIRDCARANGVNQTTMKERLDKGYICGADMKRPPKK